MSLSLFSKLQKEIFLSVLLYSVYGIDSHLKGKETHRVKLAATLVDPVYTIPFSHGNGIETFSYENGIV